MRLFTNVLDVSLDHDHARHAGSLGVNVTHKQNTNDSQETGVRPLIPNYQQISTGVFFIEKIRRNNWTLEVGARYDYQFLQVATFINNRDLVKPQFNFHYFSGLLGANYTFTDALRITNNFSFSTRPPHVSELYSEGLHHGTAAIEEGLMRPRGEVLTDQQFINKEKSMKWISTLQVGRGSFTADFSIHANVIDNYVFLRPVESRLTIRGYFPVWRYEQTNALLTGADALINWDATKSLTYTGKFAYLYARDISRNDALIFIPPPSMDHSITWHKTIGRLDDCFFKVSVPTVFRQTAAPITVYPSAIPDYSGERIYDIAPAPAQYTLLNLELGFQLPVKDNRLHVSIAGENLGNVTYRNYMNRLRYFADDIGRNFILRLKYSFHKHD